MLRWRNESAILSDYKSKAPLVSVIIPTHNRAELIGRAIRSVLDQTHRNIELIVVDDSSKDDTERIVSGIDDSRVTYVRSDEHIGAAAARNMGIDIARGTFIAFQDDDDEWLPDKLAKQVDCFNSGPPNLGLVYTGIIAIQDGIEHEVTKNSRGMIYESQLKEDQILNTATWLVRSKCFNDSRVGRFDEALPARQDYDMSLRLSRYYLIDCCDECLVRINRDTESCISKDIEKRVAGHLMVLAKINRDCDMTWLRRRRLNSSHYYSIGRYYQAMMSIQDSKRFMRMSIMQWPFNARAAVFLFFLSIGDDELRIFRVFREAASAVKRRVKSVTRQ